MSAAPNYEIAAVFLVVKPPDYESAARGDRSSARNRVCGPGARGAGRSSPGTGGSMATRMAEDLTFEDRGGSEALIDAG